MYMTDVMTKLKEIVESGYDNEDIQRGIDAASKHQVEEAEVAEDASNFKSAVARIKKAKSAKDLKKLEKSFERVYKQTDALTDKEFGQLDDMISDKLVKLGEEVEEAEVEAVEEDAVEEVHEEVEEDTSLADMLKLAGRSGVMGLSQNNIIAESLELDEDESRPDGKRFAGPTKSHTGGPYDFPNFDDPDDDDLEDLEDLEEAYINTSNDAIDTLGELRKIGKSIERGQGEYEGNLANKYANDVYDVISWVENNLDANGPNYKKVIGPVIELLKKAKGMERETGSGKDARFGNEIVNTLYPLMQWIEMNAHGSGVKEVEEEAIDEAEVELDEAEVEETVEVPVAALEELMRLAGYENYEAKIDEYENDPQEEYMDAEDQLVGLSGGLNGPKGMYPTAAGGDNAMAVSALKVKEDTLSFESFYKKYQEFGTEEK